MKEDVQRELEQAVQIYQQIVEFFVAYSVQIVGAIIVMLIGLLVAKKVAGVVFTLLEKKRFDVTLSRFVSSTVRMIIIVMVSIIALEKVGISVTPFLALVGAMSLGAGLAIQGVLSNYGAGLNIIFTRPFVVGDTIEVQGVSGQVMEVHLAYTLLRDEDAVDICIPNKKIVGEVIHNSHRQTLAELSIGIAYSEDPEVAIAVITKAVDSVLEGMVKNGKQQRIGIEAFADSSINIGIRVWLPTQHYYDQLYAVNQAVYSALKVANITIPFPQREVRLLSTDANP